MAWNEIAGHLTRVSQGTPPSHALMNRNPCALRYIRLRDIAKYLKIEYRFLTAIKRGDHLNAKLQARLSWYFHAELRGRITKEQSPDGTWHLIYRSAQSQAHPDAARPGALASPGALPRIVFTDQGPRLKL